MAKAPIADQVDHYILVKGLAVAHCQPDGGNGGFRIVSVDVKDRRFDHLRNVGTIGCRAGIVAVVDGKADLVIDNDVDGSAGVEVPCLRHLEGFRHDALSGEGGIAVNQHRENLVPLDIAAAVLTRPNGSLHDGIDDLQVRRIEGEHHMNVVAGRSHVRGKAHVVLDVAGAAELAQIAVRGELGEKFLGRLAENVDQDIEPPAMRHPDHDFLDAPVPCGADHVVENRNQRLAAFQREPLLPDKLGVEVAFETLCAVQAGEHAAASLAAQAAAGPVLFESLPQPEPLPGTGYVGEFHGDPAAIDPFQHVQDIPEFHPRVSGSGKPSGEVLGVQVGFIEAEKIQLHDRWRGPFPQVQGIQVRDLMPTQTVDLNEPGYRSLLFAHLLDGRAPLPTDSGGDGERLPWPFSFRPGYGLLVTFALGAGDRLLGLFALDADDRFVRPCAFGADDRLAGHIPRLFAADSAEISLPFRRNAARILEIGFVKRFHVGRVAPLDGR